MKKVISISLLIIAFSVGKLNAQGWYVYDGSQIPDLVAGWDDSSNDPGPNMVQEVQDDSENPENKVFLYVQPDPNRLDGTPKARKYYRHQYSDNNPEITMVARLKGVQIDSLPEATILNIEYSESAPGSYNVRDALLINQHDSTLKLERAGNSVKVNADLHEWHTYRIVFSALDSTSTIYFDEDETPVLTGKSTANNGDGQNYLRMGDGGSARVGGYTDYFLIDTTGAYAPGEGAEIPGEESPAAWYIYNGGQVPDQIYGWDDSSNDPGPNMVEEVQDDPDNPGSKIFMYVQPDPNRLDGTPKARKYYRHQYSDNNPEITMVARLKGVQIDSLPEATILNIEYSESSPGSYNVRDALLINQHDSTLKLERAGNSVKVNADLHEWHTYRIVFSALDSTSTIYFDENETPVLTGKSTANNGDGQNYLRMGDGGSARVGGYTDYFLIDTTGAYAPGEGAEIPDDPILISDITISLQDNISELTVGNSVNVLADITPGNATNKGIDYTVEPSTVASIDASGKLTALSAGTATISAKAQDVGGVESNQITLKIVDPVLVSGITISLQDDIDTLTIGNSVNVIAVVTPDDADDKTVDYTVEPSSVATIDASGKLTAVSAGTANISAKARDAGGVVSNQISLVIAEVPSGIKTFSEQGIEVYPIPASSSLTIHFTDTYLGETVRIYDIYGRELMNVIVDKSLMTIDVTNLNKGLYIMSLESDSNRAIQEIVIE